MRYVLAVLLLLSFAFAQNEPAQPLRDSSLPEADRVAIQHRLKLSDDQIVEMNISATDLNGDSIPEILAKATDSQHCGVVGNCTFWVLQKNGTDYKTILKAIAQDYRIRTIKTGGFLDIELSRHGSAYRTEWRGYKYNGRNYVKVKCWANVTGDGDHEYPKPKVEPCTKR